ncbi:MAG: hypothetical protein JO060_08645 [Candidatus Eremiobacteraeota bacterium]|nr:hypothetical protein [Candidatus Eremiobacteraeota bacterium]MBV9647318.1 hypothetical protein [Candidatus Eremiobacteraeota bacterium]
MLQQVHSEHATIPTPSAGVPPDARSLAPYDRRAQLRGDGIDQPRAHPSIPISKPPRHLVNGTPEVLLAGAGIAGLAIGADVAALSTAAALRAGASYVARLAQSMLRCVADPVKTGEHVAEGVVGGAAWAGAAAGVGALAEAARSHGAGGAVRTSGAAPH